MITNRDECIHKIESEYKKEEIPAFNIGDTIKVHFKIVEGKRERIQVFEGAVIAMKGSGIGRTVMVRKISSNIGVERVFPIHSPKIDKIELSRRGKIRRAKLYYLRDRVGKAAQVKRRMETDKSSDKKKGSKSKEAKTK